MNIKKEENTNFKFESESKDQQSYADILSEEILSVLEINVSVPESIVDKVINKKNRLETLPAAKFDYSKYLQIAVVFVAAILVGILMGKNVSTISLKRQNSDEKALIELRDKHHLSDNNSFGKL